MAELYKVPDISSAWVVSMEHLLVSGGKEANLMVSIASCGAEVPAVRKRFDAFLAEHESPTIRRIRKVADTIFPTDFYRGEPGEAARERLYRLQRRASRIERRQIPGGTYFDRLADWPGVRGDETELDRNQLERRILRLKKARDDGKVNLCATQLAVSSALPSDGCEDEAAVTCAFDGGDLRVQDPLLDNCTRGFPCLSHISLTLHRGRLNLTATYRSQHFMTKAYGNFVGLSDLQRFIAVEVGCQPGELLCIATKADGEFGTKPLTKTAVTELVRACRADLDASIIA